MIMDIIEFISYCKIEYGKANEGGVTDDGAGGAIYVKYFDKVIVSNCLIKNNKAKYWGGGIYLESSSAQIKYTP